MNEMLKFEINVAPRTKKNHQQIIMVKGKRIVIPSKQYSEYEKNSKSFMPTIEKPIDYKVNVKGLFYMDTKRKVDLNNLLEALTDVLVKHKILEDDNSMIVVSHDGSRVLYDKENPRTEVEITEVDEDYGVYK